MLVLMCCSKHVLDCLCYVYTGDRKVRAEQNMTDNSVPSHTDSAAEQNARYFSFAIF